jgi:NADH:ubiquinone oxidoreductase subunit 6 (subunit J)
MLTRAPVGISADLDAVPGRRVAAALAGVGVAALVGGTLLVAVGSTSVRPDRVAGTAEPLGRALFGGWLLPFELLSVLLLAALVAALAISRGDPESSA